MRAGLRIAHHVRTVVSSPRDGVRMPLGLPDRAERIDLGDGLHGGRGTGGDEGLPVGRQGVGVGHVQQGNPVLGRPSTTSVLLGMARSGRQGRLRTQYVAVLVEVAVLLHSGTHLGCTCCSLCLSLSTIYVSELPFPCHRTSHGRHLPKVRHQGRPVSRAQGARVDRSATGVGREGEVRGDPTDGGDEARHTLRQFSRKEYCR